MKKVLFCIVGPSGCGKSTITEKLNKLGYKSPNSYTTRPMRYPNESGHTFITQEEFDNLQNMVAYTHFNGYDYGVTKEMLDDCDIYIVDPDGIKSLRQNYNNFKVIGLQLDKRICIERMKNRGDSLADIQKRITNDDIMFNNFTDICDYIIDANNTVDKIVNLIIDYMKKN